MYSGSGPGYAYGDDGGASFQCSTSYDCAAGYTCGYGGTCTWVGFQDASADCVTAGCPYGQVCEIANGIAACVSFDSSISIVPDASSTQGQDAGGPDAVSSSDAAGDSAVLADGASTQDASDAAAPPAVPCNADATCGGSGARCIDGFCAPQSSLCSDTSQCASAGEACVDGICLPRCSSAAPTCPDGYACDFNRNVCDVSPSQCSTSASCQGGSVCVEGRCVAPCTSNDAGETCPAGLVCINGGCIPDQAASFECRNDGQGGTYANTCAGSQTCLHHSCYDNCDTDGGAACATGVCKEVTVQAGTYAVCGTTTTLGSQCDPATGHLCTSGVCIDGYCVP